MTSSSWMVLGSLLGACGVALGAFGAHGLKTRVDPAMLAVFDLWSFDDVRANAERILAAVRARA